MSSSKEFVQYVCDQISDVGQVRFRSMFGEFMIYLNDKPILLVCEDTVFIKKHESILELMKDADVGFPYSGSKEHFILDIDNPSFTHSVLRTLEPHLSVPVQRKPNQMKD